MTPAQLIAALNNNFAFGYEGGNRPDASEHRSNHRPDNANRHRKFNESFVILVSNNDSANIPLVYQFFDLGNNSVASYDKFFGFVLFVIHT